MNEQKLDKQKCVYIVGSYINACSIYRSIVAAGNSIPIVMIDTTITNGECLADIVCSKARIIKKRLSSKDEFLDLIDGADDNSTTKYILFTDETYIDVVKKAIQEEKLRNVVSSTGSETGNDKIFDRLLFYRFIEKLGTFEALTPRTIEGTQDPFSLFDMTFVIRLRQSWHSGVVLPSITIVRDKQQYQTAIEAFQNAGLTPDDWCYQELLSVSDKHNISVCGWHDRGYHQYLVTRKVLQHPPKTGNGDVVENINDYPRILTEATDAILTAMDYRGPFEMEFVFDEKSNNYKIIELNPRYWMQHGLFEELTNHLLVRKSLNEDASISIIPSKEFKHRYWINANRFWYRLLKGQLSIIQYLKGGTCYPKLTQSLRWIPHYNKYINEQRG